jgi:hypothetical protein
MACWPASMFLWAFYSEALFVALTAGAFWADLTNRRRTAVVFVLAAGLTRSPGLVLGPVLVLVHLWNRRRQPRPADQAQRDRAAVAYGLASVTALIALLVLGRVVAGDPLAVFHAQLAWGRVLAAPWVPMVEGARHLVGTLPGFAGETAMNLAATVAFAALGVWGLAQVRRRPADTPVGPALWTLAATVLPLFTVLLTSMVRLVIGAWTGLVLLAVLLQDRPRTRTAVWAVSSAVSVVLLWRWSRGTFVA